MVVMSWIVIFSRFCNIFSLLIVISDAYSGQKNTIAAALEEIRQQWKVHFVRYVLGHTPWNQHQILASIMPIDAVIHRIVKAIAPEKSEEWLQTYRYMSRDSLDNSKYWILGVQLNLADARYVVFIVWKTIREHYRILTSGSPPRRPAAHICMNYDSRMVFNVPIAAMVKLGQPKEASIVAGHVTCRLQWHPEMFSTRHASLCSCGFWQYGILQARNMERIRWDCSVF